MPGLSREANWKPQGDGGESKGSREGEGESQREGGEAGEDETLWAAEKKGRYLWTS